jgi:hypothetical protein
MNKNKQKQIVLSVILILLFVCISATAQVPVPCIDGQWWQVASTPNDLGKYNSNKQQPVDFGLWQAKDGSWQLWSCIRHTTAPGHTRLFYRWEGKNITDTNWNKKGIVMTSKSEFGEPLNGLQAPHTIKFKDEYWMFYGDWDDICIAKSKNGKEFVRLIQPDGTAAVFSEGHQVNTRDAMLIRLENKWHCYYTAFPAGHGYVFCRTSEDLLQWSKSVITAYGGKAGNNPYSCECPHVVEPMEGHYYLFRTQKYGPGSKTSIYHSENPFNFGIDDDSYYVKEMNICAPEIVKHEGQYYIAALNPNLDGIRIAKLKWQ